MKTEELIEILQRFPGYRVECLIPPTGAKVLFAIAPNSSERTLQIMPIMRGKE